MDHDSPSRPTVADFCGFGGNNHQKCRSILRDQPFGIPHQMVHDDARLADGNKSGRVVLSFHLFGARETSRVVRKLIAFDEDTFNKLTHLGRDRMATIQELADEAFADLLKKHGIPIDLKDALRKSAGRSKMVSSKMVISKTRTPSEARSRRARKTRS
jgi:hypothetical protein